MKPRPWFKFYPRDWRGDQALRAVSLGARGLWMEILCLMHEAEPRGHLLLNGKKVDVDTLARMVGASPDEVSAWMAELQTAGVFSHARNGTVTSRRMIRDEKAANEGAKSVTKRWKQDADNKGENRDPNRSTHSPPTKTPITQRPEARDIRPSHRQQQRGESEQASGSEPVAAAVPFDGLTSERLVSMLRSAAGYEDNPAADLFVAGPIFDLLVDGFDLDREILPVIRARAAAMRRPAQSWRYFVPAIREARDRPQPARSTAGDADDLAAELAEARRRIEANIHPSDPSR